MLENSYKKSWKNEQTPRSGKYPKFKWWFHRGDLNRSGWKRKVTCRLWAAPALQGSIPSTRLRPGDVGQWAVTPISCPGGLQWMGIHKKTNLHFIYVFTVSHPRADLGENKRPHFRYSLHLRKKKEYGSNICAVLPLWKKSRGVLSVCYTFLKDSKCNPGY